MSTSASTRSGWASTSRRAIIPPIEWPEEPELVGAHGIRHRDRVRSQPVERVRRRVGRTVTLTVATMIERDDVVAGGERLDLIREVLLRAAEPMDEEEGGTAPLLDDLEPDAVVDDNPHDAPPPNRPAGARHAPHRPHACRPSGPRPIRPSP